MTITKTEFNSAIDEVVISVNFNKLPNLSVLHLSELLNHFNSKGFSKVQEHAPIQPPLEPSQEITVDAQIDVAPPFPRIWFIHQRNNKIIQIQRDWFAFNYRRYGTYTDIPSYSIIFREFRNLYDEFSKFIKDKQIGTLNPIQYELGYIYQVYQDNNEDIFTSIGKTCNIFNDVDNLNLFWAGANSLNLRIFFQTDRPHNWIFLGANNRIKLPERNQILHVDLRSINFKVDKDENMDEWFNLVYKEIEEKANILYLDGRRDK